LYRKLQTSPLVREGATHQETRNSQTENKKSGHGLQMGARQTVGRKLTSTSLHRVSGQENKRFGAGFASIIRQRYETNSVVLWGLPNRLGYPKKLWTCIREALGSNDG
jgi:hypothetical protein